MRLNDAELDALLAPMRDGPIPLSSVAEGAALRARLLPAVRTAVGSAPVRLHRARIMRRAAGVAIGCSAVLAALAIMELRSVPRASVPPLRVEALGSEPMTFIDGTGVEHVLTGDAPIAVGGELVAPASSWARVLTARGARVELAPRTRLRVTSAPAADRAAAGLRLERGEVHCSVPHLGTREQFSISTPDAQVIVHGTVFSVRVAPGPVPSTCVRVNEGLVEVRHAAGNTLLGPGMQWGCDAAAPAPTIAVRADGASSESAREPQAARLQPRVQARATRTPSRSGTLEQETALLAAALAAERGGPPERARRIFAELLTRYPRSPLVPEARAGVARTR